MTRVALPDEPTVALLATIRTALTGTAAVMGERPADLVDQLPVVTLTRIGGTAMASLQGLVGDSPLISGDVYADSLPAAYALMAQLRRAMWAAGARENSGPIPTTDAAEAAGVRRLTATWRFQTH